MSTPTTKSIPFGSIAFSLEGLKALFADLEAIVKEQGEFEIGQLVKPNEQTEEDFLKYKGFLRDEVFNIMATVDFEDGSAVYGRSSDILKLNEGGPFIERVYISNVTPYQSHTNVEPEHKFSLYLDLKNPPLLDATRLLSSETENNTFLEIRGRRPGWIPSVESSVRKHIYKRRHFRTFFHGSFVYDLFLMLIGIPLAIYACWRVSDWANAQFAKVNGAVLVGFYLYVAFGVLWLYRILFSYTKWAFPKVELIDQRTKPSLHRKIWWGLVAVLAGKLFWDVADPYVSLKVWWHSIIAA